MFTQILFNKIELLVRYFFLWWKIFSFYFHFHIINFNSKNAFYKRGLSWHVSALSNDIKDSYKLKDIYFEFLRSDFGLWLFYVDANLNNFVDYDLFGLGKIKKTFILFSKIATFRLPSVSLPQNLLLKIKLSCT